MELHQIVDILIDKRLGLTEFNDNIIESYLFGNYYHVACAMEAKNNKFIPLSYGMNSFKHNGTSHAESDAIRHLIPRQKKKKNKNIDILVIKITKQKQISISKPCFHCMLYLNKIPPKKGYKINNIYYSDHDGNIIESSFSFLCCNTTHLSKYYRKKN
jgi:cytidine deaminase